MDAGSAAARKRILGNAAAAGWRQRGGGRVVAAGCGVMVPTTWRHHVSL